MNRQKRFVVGLVVAAALLVTLVPAAMAAEPTPPWGGWGFGGMGFGGATLGTIAKTLNVTTDQLVERLRAGDTVAKIAAEKGVDLGTVVDAALAPQKDLLQLRVSYGYITQTQADTILTNMQEQLTQAFEQGSGTGYGFGGYGMGGWGHMGGFGGGWGRMGGMMGGFGPGGMMSGFGWGR